MTSDPAAYSSRRSAHRFTVSYWIIEIRDRDFGAGGGCTRRERAGKRRLTDTTLLRHESDDQ